MLCLLPLLALVRETIAHGHVVTWRIKDDEMTGFDPDNMNDHPKTAQRPTDGQEQGMLFHVPNLSTLRIAYSRPDSI